MNQFKMLGFAAISMLVLIAGMAGYYQVREGLEAKPVVYKDAATGTCVRVDDPKHLYTCSHLPEKYKQAWVIE